MTTTVSVAVQETFWTALSSGSTTVSVQRQGGVPIKVRVEPALPAASDDLGIVLSEVYDSASFTGLAGTDVVYGRSMGGPANVTVVRS